MKYFLHYKNKPYKYLGVAKHSETLEDLVIYETRYENNQAKTWVRPKDMFFENVEVAGVKTARFKKVHLDIKTFANITESEIKDISVVIEKAFGEWDPSWFNSTLQNHTKYFLWIAYIEEQVVGFKLGYEVGKHEFYSWLGGVIPDYHGLGIGSDLMRAQHTWCKENGYKKIQTKTQNRFREMLLLNIKFGFDVIGYQISDEGGPKIILEKIL